MSVDEKKVRRDPPPITVYANAEEFAALEQLCDYEGRSKTAYIRYLLRREMRQHELFQSAANN